MHQRQGQACDDFLPKFIAPRIAPPTSSIGHPLLLLGSEPSEQGLISSAAPQAPDRRHKFRDRTLSAVCDFGVARASAAVRDCRYLAYKQKLLQLGLWVPVGVTGTIKVSYESLDNSAGSAARTSGHRI